MSNPLPSLETLKRAAAIAEQIQQLQVQLASVLEGNSGPSMKPKASNNTSKAVSGKRTMSAASRAKIAAAAKKRWAKVKGEATPAPAKAAPAAKVPPAAKKKKGGITAEGRAKLAAAMKARWAARKAGSPAPNQKNS